MPHTLTIVVRRFVLGAVCIPVILAGCARQPPDRSAAEAAAPAVPLPAAAQLTALRAEDERRYLAALDYWRQAEALIGGRIAALTETLKLLSEGRAQRGVVSFENRNGQEAFEEFIEALRLDPTNPVALDYLKNRYAAERSTLYTVREGDTPATIGAAVYGSTSYAFMVTHFSDAGGDADLSEGDLVSLPALDSFYSPALRDYKANIVVARRLFKEKNYQKALARARAIVDAHPEDKEASYIINMSLLAIAEQQRDREQFADAAETLSQVQPYFRNVDAQIREIRELQKAKQERDTLLVNTVLFQKGEELASRGDFIGARNVLRQVDPRFPGREKVLAEVTRELQAQAEIHFKKGVRLFVEENPAAAITEWETALRLDPGHQEAMNSLEKAHRLVEKFKKIN